MPAQTVRLASFLLCAGAAALINLSYCVRVQLLLSNGFGPCKSRSSAYRSAPETVSSMQVTTHPASLLSLVADEALRRQRRVYLHALDLESGELLSAITSH
jgi:hypothetical protein